MKQTVFNLMLILLGVGIAVVFMLVWRVIGEPTEERDIEDGRGLNK